VRPHFIHVQNTTVTTNDQQFLFAAGKGSLGKMIHYQCKYRRKIRAAYMMLILRRHLFV
jgi:hypothetical protein